MKLKKIVGIFIILLCTACASKKLIVTSSDPKDLVETFDLNKEEIKKFATVKRIKKKKKFQKRVKFRRNARRIGLNNTKTKKLKKKKVVKIKDPSKNEDYPKKYREYNEKFKVNWDLYKKRYFPGEKFHMELSWSIFTAGTVVLETLGDLEINNMEVLGFKARLVSAKYFESIYKLRDTLFSYVTKDEFRPVKYVLKQRESAQTVDDLQIFDYEKLKTYFWYNGTKKGKTKKYKKEKYMPKYFADSFSALYFMRGLPLKIGDVYEFPILTRTKVWILKAKVDKIEEIDIMNKDVKAFKIKIETRFSGVLKKSGDINFWYSADKVRKILKFEAKVKLGMVKGILKKYEAGSLSD